MYSYYGKAYQSAIWLMVSLILGVIGGICLYVFFVREKRDLTNPKLIKLRDFLQFRTLIIEPVLKALYCILAVFITLYSFSLIGSSFIGFLMVLIFGNIIVRLCYEGSMIVLMIWRNTSEINKKMIVKYKDKCECEEPKIEKEPIKNEAKKEDTTKAKSEDTPKKREKKAAE